MMISDERKFLSAEKQQRSVWHRFKAGMLRFWRNLLIFNHKKEEEDYGHVGQYAAKVISDLKHPAHWPTKYEVHGSGKEEAEKGEKEAEQVAHPLAITLLDNADEEAEEDADVPEGNPAAADDAFADHWNNQHWNAQERPAQAELGYDDRLTAFWNHAWWNNTKWAAGTAYHDLIGAMEYSPVFAGQQEEGLISRGAADWNPTGWAGGSGGDQEEESAAAPRLWLAVATATVVGVEVAVEGRQPDQQEEPEELDWMDWFHGSAETH